jgi:hypothetical protein
LSVLIPKQAGNPVIDADPSRSGADQPDQDDDDVHGFRQIEEIVEPVEKREPFRNRRKLAVMIATIIWLIRAAQHRLENNPMTSSQPLMNSIEETK